MRNIRRSPLWSSWFVFLLISYMLNQEDKEKSSVELMVCFLIDFRHFQ